MFCYLLGFSETTAKDAAEELRRVRQLEAPLHRRRQRMMHLRQVYKVGAGRVWGERAPAQQLMHVGVQACKNSLDSLKVQNYLQYLINGQFGASGVAVFNLIRDLISLNSLVSVVMCLSLVLPQVLQEPQPITTAAWVITNTTNNDNCPPVLISYDNIKVNNCSISYVNSLGSGDNETWIWDSASWVSEMLLGKGRREYSPLFLGFYPVLLVHDNYPVAAAQLLAVVIVFLASLVMVVKRVGQWLRYNPSFWGELTFSKMVFAGWDFNLRHVHCITSKQHVLRNDIRAALDEYQFQRSKSSRTTAQLLKLYVKRLIVNCLIFVAMSVGYMIIVIFTNYRPFLEELLNNYYSQDSWQKETLDSLISYLDILTVWLVNLLLPMLLSLLGSLEEYSSRVSMLLFILRNAAIRLISLGVLVASHLILVSSHSTRDCRSDMPCWETALAQKLYAQLMWDFVIRVVWTALLLTHKLLSIPFTCLKISIFEPEFDVPGRVLDVLTLQTLCWLSVPVSPLLPLLVLVSLCVLLWCDVIVALLTSKSSSHIFQVSHSSAIFMVVMAVSWVGAATVTVVVLFFIPPSLGCGPFRGLSVAWDALAYYTCNLEGSVTLFREVMTVLNDVVVAASIGAVLVMAALYYLWILQLRSVLVKRLENKLKEIFKDKVFLMERQQRYRDCQIFHLQDPLTHCPDFRR
ncbi:transmembrane channel-like protein 7 [Cherax quadricarinatus]|uniref:transmembrane channel-like protein 7 n=1 Tax=Cherax quadricarinatus TaxID=27406 RepID=UPI00387E7FF4